MAFLAPQRDTPHRLDAHATHLFTLALKEGWPGVLLSNLFDGCAVTIDPETRRPVFITADEIKAASGE